MKVLHVITSPRAEGTVRLVLDWLQEIKDLEQYVLVLSPAPAELTAELRQAATGYAETRGLPAGPGKFPWLVWKTCSEVSRVRPDCVICWPTGFAGFVLLGAYLAGARSLLAHSGNPPTPTTKGFLHGMMTAGIIWPLGAKMICCSHYVAARFRDEACFPRPLLRSVWNCAQVEGIRARASAARRARVRRGSVILMVATLELHKDHDTLLRAMVEVRAKRPDAELWLAGGGSLRPRLESLAVELAVGQSVRFLGSRKDIPELLGQADLFVFSTTVNEGLGTVLVEALAAELPIVASDVPACRELLEGGRWGALITAGDVPSLALEILRQLKDARATDPESRARFLEKFSVATMAGCYLALPQPHVL